MMRVTNKYLLLLLLAGCGGNNSAISLINSLAVSTYPLRAAYLARVTNGVTLENYTAQVGTNCSGTATVVITKPVGAPFEGNATALSITETDIATLPTCTPSVLGLNTTTYFDSNYTPLGFTVPGTTYGVMAAATALPVTVTTGASGVYGTLNLFTDSTKIVSAGTMVLSYAVTNKDSSNDYVKLIATTSTAGSGVVGVQTSTYTIGYNSVLTPVSVATSAVTATGTLNTLFTKI